MQGPAKRLVLTALDGSAAAVLPGVVLLFDEPQIGFACLAVLATSVYGIWVARSAWADAERHRAMSVEWMAPFIAVSGILGAIASDTRIARELDEALIAIPAIVALGRVVAERWLTAADLSAVRIHLQEWPRRHATPIAVSLLSLLVAVAVIGAVMGLYLDPRRDTSEAVNSLLSRGERGVAGSADALPDDVEWKSQHPALAEGMKRVAAERLEAQCLTVRAYRAKWLQIDTERLEQARKACADHEKAAATERSIAARRDAEEKRKQEERDKHEAEFMATNWAIEAQQRLQGLEPGVDAPISVAHLYAAWVQGTDLQRAAIADALNPLRVVWTAEVRSVTELREHSSFARTYQRTGWRLFATADCRPNEGCNATVVCDFPLPQAAVLADLAVGEAVQVEGSLTSASLVGSELTATLGDCTLP